MSYSSFSDNDDDLFDDNVSLSSSASTSSNTPSDDFKTLIESIDKKEFDKIDRMFFRSKVALTLIDGANSYIFENNSYNRSIFNTLNYLTNNQFQYELFADVLEESILRRMIIRDFLLACVDNTSDDILKKLSKLVDFDIDYNFLNTYFYSFLEILNFAINDNIELYQKVCNQLNRQPLSNIIDGTFNENSPTLIGTNDYINNVFQNIKHSFGHGYFQ